MAGMDALGGAAAQMAMQIGKTILKELSKVMGDVMGKLGGGDLQGALKSFEKMLKLSELMDKLTKMMGGGDGANKAEGGGKEGTGMPGLGAMIAKMLGGNEKTEATDGASETGATEGASEAGGAGDMPPAPQSPMFGQKEAKVPPTEAMGMGMGRKEVSSNDKAPPTEAMGAVMGMGMGRKEDGPKSEVDAGRSDRKEGLSKAADHGQATKETAEFDKGMSKGEKKGGRMDPQEAIDKGTKLAEKAAKETDPEKKAYLEGKAQGMIESGTKRLEKKD
jgi:hypothetical protein